MTERFDDLSRGLAQSTSRRGVLKMFVAAAAAATAATVLKPFRSDAACVAGQTPCGSACCAAGVACLNAAKGKCGCAAGTTQCGTEGGQPFCCSGTCSDPGTNCCCESGQTPCGRACCANGVTCLNKSKGICGCPAGYSNCGSGTNRTCCPAGKACGNASCVPLSDFQTTVKECSAGTVTCAVASGDGCFSQLDCGGGCFCNQNVSGGSPNGGTFCTQPTNCDNQNCSNNTDCPSGQVCQATCCDQPKCFVVCGTSTAAPTASPARTTGQSSAPPR